MNLGKNYRFMPINRPSRMTHPEVFRVICSIDWQSVHRAQNWTNWISNNLSPWPKNLIMSNFYSKPALFQSTRFFLTVVVFSNQFYQLGLIFVPASILNFATKNIGDTLNQSHDPHWRRQGHVAGRSFKTFRLSHDF